MSPVRNIDRLLFYSLAAVFLTIPLPMIINNLAIFLFLALSLLNIKKLQFHLKPIYLFFPLIFVLSALSLFYNCSLEAGLKGQEKILSFILFYLFIPIVRISASEIKTILILFADICLALLIWCFISALYLSISNQTLIIFNPENLVNENYFLYHRFSSAVGLHAVYFSVYLIFAAIIYLYYFKSLSIRNNAIFACKVIILFVGIFLLQSFAALFALALIAGAFLLIFNKKLLSKKMKILVLSGMIILPALIFYTKASVASNTIFNYNLEDDVHSNKWNSLNVRLAKWECAIDASVKNLPLGVGSGCTKAELKEVYLEKGFLLAYDKGFDTHNQYLHYFLKLGLPGIIIYITFIMFALYYSFKTNNFLLFSLLILLSVCSITENVLYNNKGIVFFSAFFYLLIKKNEKQ